MSTAIKRILRLKPEAPPINKVMGYKNEAVVARLEKDLKLTAPVARTLFKDMLRFLYIARATNIHPVSPPKMIDEAWHTFIIYTEDYANFCQSYFGSFIHHRPHRPGEKHGNEGAVNCQKLARKIFGKNLSPNWGKPENVACEDCRNQCSKTSCSTKSCDSSCREECCI